MKKDILSLTPEELSADVKALGFPPYRAGQIGRWLADGVRDFAQMTDLPKGLRETLDENYYLYRPQVLSSRVSETDGTIKYLWELRDKNTVETVVMSYRYGNTVCISTQVGCRQGCAFCASTIGGLVRGLDASEMFDEVLFSQIESGKKISHVVLMGIGEPLDNFDNVARFLALLNDPKRLNLGLRHVTLSTCGLTERFDDLAALDLPITLTVSLHAPDDETRSRLMPANRGRGVEALMDGCRRYFAATGRRISFEYAMIDGVNDTAFHARLLADRARSCGAHVNLIALNHVEERPFKPSTQGHMKAFMKILDENGVNYTLRRRLGSDVDASCGQLRRRMQKQNRTETRSE